MTRKKNYETNETMASQEHPRSEDKELYCARLNRRVDVLEIIVQLAPEIIVHSELRKAEGYRRVREALARFKPYKMVDSRGPIVAHFAFANEKQANQATATLSSILRRFRREALTPQMVEECLGISSDERVRWNKDGRLPKSGMGSFRRGNQSIHFYLHPPDQIAELVAHPEIIEAWRKQDGLTSD